MKKTIIPEGYKSLLSLYETQTAIGMLKRTFEDELKKALNLRRVSAPLFVDPNTGLNDNLNGVERPVSFDILQTNTEAQIVHSLAKWKRMALHKYGFQPGEGLYTDMNAIRRDEEMDNLHSIYVDQWDWEKVIKKEDRHVDYLKETVKSIVNAVCDTLDAVKKDYPQIPVELSRDVSFVTTQELEDMYPSLSPRERENAYLKEHKTAFIMQIGDLLKSGQKHDGRSPDYDDWKLNGDILFWNDVLGSAFEISSMGIRVDAKSLDEQLTKANCDDRRSLPFHKMLLNNELPLTIGGGIGQSRICMLLLAKAHIGEVQVSVWDEESIAACQEKGINLL
ncbi:aspartate--ammonia ligase [Acetivibrio mesophilus]|uniref:Aspartate--ammonia ligase n=1 Tax=Acetivibrio mesophilus TaxID=2487273 RepID=A0A4Q0I236_9FIRM|nr:aspartate--ammonia ligase [Acetivibrio mesophilus]ODM28080.1 aspartate--ammonia ligase [Clostridium sp. Bc-iso-3]RXE58226.1 aspartate--ammonia ligase [Acetivibrio mesophilus]HHV29252.1 aspartate--ammonia ligase [Clostridium sp.]